MWGITSRYPTLLLHVLLPAVAWQQIKDLNSGGKDKRRVGKQIKSNIKMPSLSIHPNVNEHSGKVCTHNSGLKKAFSKTK